MMTAGAFETNHPQKPGCKRTSRGELRSIFEMFQENQD
jgi:hypothetical protein